MGKSKNDPLGILTPAATNDPLGILVDVEKKSPSGTELPTGTSNGSQFKSASVLPSDEDKFKDEIVPKVAEIAKRQDDKTSGLFAAPTLPGDQLTENIMSARSNRILAGDTDEMVRTIKKERDILNARKETKRTPTATPIAMGSPLVMGSPTTAFDDDAEYKTLESELNDIKEAVAKKVDKEAAQKLLQSPYENLPLIAQERRKKLADIGMDNVFEDEKGAAQYAKSNDRALGGIIKIQKNKDSELFEYNNAAGLLNATLKEQQEQLEKMTKDTKVEKYLNGTPEEQALLGDDPTIQEFETKRDRFRFMYEQRESLENKYPTVKYEKEKKAIADLYAERLNMRNKALGMFGEANVFRRVGEITVGNRPEESDIEAMARQLNLPVEDVRKHVEMDDIRMPSLLGRTWLAATGVAQSAGQGIIRNVMDKDAANVINREIGETKYATNEKYADKYSADWIFDKMSNGLGQMVGFVALGTAASAPVKLAAGIGRGAVAVEAATGAGRAVVGVDAAAAASEIAAAGSGASGSALAAGASSAVARTTMATVNNRISEMLVRSATKGATFGTGYMASYEDAYKEAAINTDDENQRHTYAQGVAAANGVSELLLNDIDMANKILKGVPPAEILSRMAGKKTPFTTGNVFLARVGEFARVMGYESAEELVPYFTELVMKDEMFNVKTSTAEVLKGAFDTIVETAISTVPMGAMSLNSAVPTSQLTRNAIYEGAKRADYYRSLFKDQHDAGKISAETMNGRVQLVNTLDNIYKSIPTEVEGEPLSEPKKAYITNLMLKQRQLADEMEKRDKLFKPMYAQKIKAIEAEINNVLNAPDLQEVEDEDSKWKDVMVGPYLEGQEVGMTIDIGGKPYEITEMLEIDGRPFVRSKRLPESVATTEQGAVTNTDRQDDLEDDFHINTFAQSAQEQSTPAQLLRSDNSLAQEIIDSHQISSLEEIDDSEMFTTFLTADQAGLAEAIDSRVSVTAAGNGRLTVRMPGAVLKTLLNNQDATNQTQTQDQEDGQQSSSEQYITADSSQQQSSQEAAETESAIDSDSYSGSDTQKSQTTQEGEVIPTLDQRLAAARQASAAERPTMTDNLEVARQDAERQLAREEARARRNAFTEVQSPVVTANADGTYTAVNPNSNEQDAQNIIQETEEVEGATNGQPGTTADQQQSTEPAGVTRVERSYQFGEVVKVDASELTISDSYRKGKPFIKSAEFAASQPVTEPILVHRNSRGQTMVLDGRARLLGARKQGQTNVPVRYFKGTDEQAREVAQLLRNDPHRAPATLVNKRSDMVLSRPPESFREAMLQMLLGHLGTKIKRRKPLFDLDGFKRFVSEKRTNNPYRMADGKISPEWATLIASKVLGKNAKHGKIDTFISETWVEQTGRDESDLLEELADIILAFPTREALINEIAAIQNAEEATLKQTLFPIAVTEEEAVFVAENELTDVITEIAFGEDVELTESEAARLESIVRSNTEQDGTNMDIEGVYQSVFSSNDPITQSLANKLLVYAKTKQREVAQSVISDDLAGEEQAADFEEAPFSRADQSTARKITAHQANILSRALSKVFRGAKVVVDMDTFLNKLPLALRRSQVSPQVAALVEELAAAKDILAAAQRSFAARRKELDASIKADTEDLFGERKKQPGGLFDERVDPKAREAAIKPFKDKLDKAKANVTDIQKRLDAALQGGGSIQGAMFSKDGAVMGFVLDGTVYLNPSEVRVDTPLHEIGGHLLTDWARRNSPAMMSKIMEVAATAPESVMSHVKRNYPTLEEGSEKFLEEVFATALGWDMRNINRAEKLLDAGWKNKVLQVWRDFINMLAEAGIVRFSQPFNNSEIEDMTLSDFSNLVGEVMFSGRRLSETTTPNVRAMGADFAFLAEDDFVYDNYGNIVDVKHEVKQQIVAEKERIKSDAIAKGRFMMAPDGSRTKLTEDQWLTIQTQRFKEWDINKPELKNKIIDGVKNSTGKGLYRDTMVAMADNPSQHSELLRYLIEQATDNENLLSNIVGRNVVDMVLEYEYSKGTALTENSGEPLVLIAEDGTPIFERADGNLKSAANIGTFSDETNDVRFQRIGAASNLTPLQRTNYNRAVEMEQQAQSPENIFLSTGWFRDNADGKWRYELPNKNVRFLPNVKGTDANITLRAASKYEFEDNLAADLGVNRELVFQAAKEIWLHNKTNGGKVFPKDVLEVEGTNYRNEAEFTMFDQSEYAELYRKHKSKIDKAVSVNYNYMRQFRLEEVLDYPELYAAHPDLKDMMVQFVSGTAHTGSYTKDATGEMIEIRRDDSPEVQYTTLRHEVQHALQERLGFEKGASLLLAQDYYKKKVGNIKRSIKKLEGIKRSPAQGRELVILNAELSGLVEKEKEWVYIFYRNFAGEREASSVEERSVIADEMRISMMPQTSSAASKIRHSDLGVVAQVKSSFGNFFKRNGSYRGDPLLQAVESIDSDLKGAKAIADKLRKLAKAVEGNTANLNASLLALPKALVSTALRTAAVIIEGGGTMAQAINAAYKYIATNVHRNTKLNRNEIKAGLAEMFEAEGIHANALFKRSINITRQVIDAIKDNPDFMASQEFLDLFSTPEVKYTAYMQLPEDVRDRMRALYMMNDRQLDILSDLIDRVKTSKVKNLEAKFNRELEVVKDDIVQAGKAEKNRRRVRMNADGQWEPVAIPKNMSALMDDYIKMLDEWTPVTDDEGVQRAKLRHQKQGIFLPDDVYAYSKTSIELSDVSMRSAIQRGYDSFGPTGFLSVMHAIAMNAKFNPAAKSSLFKNFMDMDLGYSYKVKMEVARVDKMEARKVSNIMAMRRLVGGIPESVEDAIDQAFGDKSAGVRDAKAAIKSALTSSDVTAVEEEHEMGLSEAEAEAEIFEIKEAAKLSEKKANKKRDAEIKRTAKESANNAKLILQQRTGAKTKEAAIKNIKERINKLKC